ncbi:uncharacterized protein LOC119683900 [Teleopsis dalmanni]|uniref:uncharacterized protein LOC119683900 n=1 Tax=Teleopsis dalmanni TaxID=139649 RepID=UPI0018CE3100|nr:uncharacterized protein LOC119683900 [Teleopsis dalmanni]
MAKFSKLSMFLVVLAVVACSAEPPRYRSLKLQQGRRRVLARQEIAPTPYPSADELKPEVPFVEEVAAQPDVVYGPPDQTYGPPQVGPSVEQLPSDEAPQQFAPNPDAEEFLPAQQAPIDPARFTKRNKGRLVNKQTAPLRSSAKLQKPVAVKSQRLVSVNAPIAAAAPAPIGVALPLQGQQYFVVNNPFAYTAQFQSW